MLIYGAFFWESHDIQKTSKFYIFTKYIFIPLLYINLGYYEHFIKPYAE